jgi:lipopolysaccharide transport system ATP-binding protein
MSSEIAIKVENLSKCYQIYEAPRDRLKQFVLPRVQRLVGLPRKDYFREFWALKEISFNVRKGETVGIIGKNGSGKSTLLQMICGTLNPTSGSIETRGRIAALLELGSGFNPEFTGRENVYMNAAVLGLSKEEADARFDEIAAFADIGQFIDQPVKTYSSGMQMRLAFAVSVCVEPEILVVDEALAVGDMAFQQKCFQRLADLRENGTTILMVSHDIMLIRNHCGHAIYLDAGIVKWAGDAETVGEAYVQDMYAERQASTGGRDRLEWREDGSKGKLAFGSIRGRVTNVRIQGEHGMGNVFRQGEVVTIEICGEIAPDVIAPEIVFQLRDARGYVLYGIPSSPDVLRITAETDHKKVAAGLQIPLSLGAGNYSITIAILDRQGQTVFAVLDKVVGIADFIVADADTRSHGCINLYGKWQEKRDD